LKTRTGKKVLVDLPQTISLENSDALVVEGGKHIEIISALEYLGAKVKSIMEPFNPEKGAYGHGRTHSHDHGHTSHE